MSIRGHRIGLTHSLNWLTGFRLQHTSRMETTTFRRRSTKLRVDGRIRKGYSTSAVFWGPIVENEDEESDCDVGNVVVNTVEGLTSKTTVARRDYGPLVMEADTGAALALTSEVTWRRLGKRQLHECQWKLHGNECPDSVTFRRSVAPLTAEALRLADGSCSIRRPAWTTSSLLPSHRTRCRNVRRLNVRRLG